jgi:anthranilate synthase component 2
VLLLLDNRDSFTFNLAQAFETLGARVVVRAARTTGRAALRRLAPSHLVIGPGPGHPAAAGAARAALEELAPEVPTLGVCLGLQVAAAHFGAPVRRAREPRHGRTTLVHHAGLGLFAGLPNPLRCARYNSLAVRCDELPDCLEATAAADGEVMALRHRTWPLEGVQFHPESVLSERGLELLANFLARAPQT